MSSAVHCPSCGAGSCGFRMRFRGMTLYGCGFCGLLFQHPVPTDEKLREIYGPDYFESWGGEALEELVRKQKAANFRKHLKRIQARMSGGKLLDVGCAKGYFVQEATAWGYDAYGLEISEHAASIASITVGEERIRVGTLESAGHEKGFFDVITMFDFLEHVTDLDSALTAATSYLRDGGLLYIVTPDISSFSFKMMGKHWWHLNEEHIHYFERGSLTRLLERFGFKMMESGPSVKTLSLEYIYSQLAAHPVPILSQVSSAMSKITPPPLKKGFITLLTGDFFMVARKAGRTARAKFP